MSDSKVVFIPSMSLTYEDNMLETVGIGGELYRRDTPLTAENSVLKAENAKLREQVARHKEIDAALARADEDLHVIEGRYGINLTNAELYMLCDAVYAINAKLRSFALELYEDQCDDCDKWRYRDRMQALGIEAEE